MKKICLLNFGKVVNSTGGAEKVLCDFANEFSKRGYEITIVCSESQKGKTYFELDKNVKFVNLGISTEYNVLKKVIRKFCKTFKINYGFILNDKMIDMTLQSIVKNASFDLVINFFPKDLIYILKNFKDIPKVQMLHSSADWLLEHIDTTTLNNLHKVNYVQVLLPSYIDKLKLSNIVSIPNVVRKERVCTKYLDKIVYLSRYDIDKQIHLLIDAFYYCIEEFPQWELHIYGAEWTPGYKDTLIKKVNLLKLEKNCFLHDRISNPIEKIIDASVCAFPSKYEGFPLALTEAMSVGLPCIGYKSCTGVNEIIINGYNGFLVENGIDEFAEKLKVLMSNKELCINMGKNAIESMKVFSPEYVYDRWEELLVNLLEKNI